jgi:hypothetical protein
MSDLSSGMREYRTLLPWENVYGKHLGQGKMYFCTIRKNLLLHCRRFLPKRPITLRFFAAFCRKALALTAVNVSA